MDPLSDSYIDVRAYSSGSKLSLSRACSQSTAEQDIEFLRIGSPIADGRTEKLLFAGGIDDGRERVEFALLAVHELLSHSGETVSDGLQLACHPSVAGLC